jgi:hypothetical protein
MMKLESYLVAYPGTEILGCDMTGGKMDLERGFWDLGECDPNTCGAAEIAAPIGTWATCEY